MEDGLKITVTRLLEATKYLATSFGQEAPDFFTYMSDFVDNAVRALRNGLTIADNFDATLKTLSVTHNTAQVITLPSGKTAVGIIPLRLVSTTYGIDSFAWYYDERGRLTVKVGITSAPSDAQQVVLAILH